MTKPLDPSLSSLPAGLSLDGLAHVWTLFTHAHDLPHLSADEVLAEVLEGGITPLPVIAWIEAFIDAWAKAEARERDYDKAMVEAEHDAVFGEAYPAPTDPEAEADLARIIAAERSYGRGPDGTGLLIVPPLKD